MKKISIFVSICILLLMAGGAWALSNSGDGTVICWTNGHCYQTIDGTFTWTAAKSDAESRMYNAMSGHLATITSQGENDFIENNFVPNKRLLGGYQPSGSSEPAGGWQWVTGETWNYTNWHSGETNNGNGGPFEDVLYIWATGSTWNDVPSTFPNPDGYVIEYEAAEQSSGPVAEYHFDGDANDSSGNGNHGTINSATFVQGVSGQALSFDGVDDNVTTQNNRSLITDNFTMELWVNPLSSHEIDPETNDDWSYYGTSGQKYAIWATWGTIYGSDHSGSGISIGTNGVSVYEHAHNYMPAILVWNSELSGWTQIVVVYKNKQPSLYVNGNFVKKGLTSSRIVHPSFELFGGSVYGNFKGGIDEVRIYDRALSAEEIKRQYDEMARPVIDISTDKTTYSPGDTMTVTLNIDNPTTSPVTFEWYIGVPQKHKWITYNKKTIPAEYNNTLQVPITVGNWGPSPLGLVQYVQLLDPATKDVLAQDAATIVYSPAAKGGPQVDIEEELMKSKK